MLAISYYTILLNIYYDIIIAFSFAFCNNYFSQILRHFIVIFVQKHEHLRAFAPDHAASAENSLMNISDASSTSGIEATLATVDSAKCPPAYSASRPNL